MLALSLGQAFQAQSGMYNNALGTHNALQGFQTTAQQAAFGRITPRQAMQADQFNMGQLVLNKNQSKLNEVMLDFALQQAENWHKTLRKVIGL